MKVGDIVRATRWWAADDLAEASRWVRAHATRVLAIGHIDCKEALLLEVPGGMGRGLRDVRPGAILGDALEPAPGFQCWWIQEARPATADEVVAYQLSHLVGSGL